nr:zinc ribbon domain-containing protein [Natronococcus pandeyae]
MWGIWQDAIEDEVEKASTRAVEYVAQFENPVIGLEYLDGITDEDIGKYWNRRLGKWLFSRLQSRIEDKAAERGIPVEYVYPHYTSKTCHACQHIGDRPDQGTFKCSNKACWVSEYQADLNAAAKIAQRLNPWGESLPVKSAGDDSPCSAARSGAPVAEPQDNERSEATLGEDSAVVSVESGKTSRGGAADDKVSSSSPAEGAGAEPETSSPYTS